PTPIPQKGRVLTELSIFWFRTLRSASPHHFVSADPTRYPAPFPAHAARLDCRSMLVRRAERIDIECVVRGFLTGSGWKEYKTQGTVCGIAQPAGLRDGSRLDPPIFTPATKADAGHDQNISFDKQFVRDWLDQSGWDHEPPAPALPDDVVAKTTARYVEAMRRLTEPS